MLSRVQMLSSGSLRTKIAIFGWNQPFSAIFSHFQTSEVKEYYWQLQTHRIYYHTTSSIKTIWIRTYIKLLNECMQQKWFFYWKKNRVWNRNNGNLLFSLKKNKGLLCWKQWVLCEDKRLLNCVSDARKLHFKKVIFQISPCGAGEGPGRPSPRPLPACHCVDVAAGVFLGGIGVFQDAFLENTLFETPRWLL